MRRTWRRRGPSPSTTCAIACRLERMLDADRPVPGRASRDMSPPALTPYSVTPARSRIAAASSTAQPLTKPDGSTSRPRRCRRSPTSRRAAPRSGASTCCTSSLRVRDGRARRGEAADLAVVLVRAERRVDVPEPVEHRRRASSTSSRTSTTIGMPMTCSTRSGIEHLLRLRGSPPGATARTRRSSSVAPRRSRCSG